MKDAELITQLREQYGEQIKITETLPKAYNPGGIDAVKAIYLGCDPTNNSFKSPGYNVSYHLMNDQWAEYRDLIKKQF